MRKYIIGFVAGLLAAFALPTYAAVSNMIGKKVQNEYTVVVDGKTLDKKAIAIDGVSYAPVRAFTNAVGYDLAFMDNTVVLSDPSMEGSVPVAAEESGTVQNLYTLTSVNDAIEGTSAAIDASEVSLKALVEMKAPQQKIDDAKSYLDEMKQKLIELQKIKAELQAQTTP